MDRGADTHRGKTARPQRQGLERCVYEPRTPRTAGRGREGFSSRAGRGKGYLGNLTLDLQPPELRDDTFLLFQATQVTVICYSSWREPSRRSRVTVCTDLSLPPAAGIGEAELPRSPTATRRHHFTPRCAFAFHLVVYSLDLTHQAPRRGCQAQLL